MSSAHPDIHEQRSYLRDLARAALAERGFLADFEPDVMAAVAGLTGPAAPVGDVRDLRDKLWASIDNDDSRDLDQLSVVEALPDGGTRLLVAIADVDALVTLGSPIDRHAWQNTTSIYMPGTVFPMLPERLSTDLTSLNQDQDRLAMIADITLSADGQRTGGELYRGLVRNRAQLAYNAVAAWLGGTAPPPPALAAVEGLAENLRLQDAAAQALRRQRESCGALTFETLEAHAVFDGERLVDLVAEPQNQAKKLIEDVMIAANETTARFLEGRGYPSLRRVVRVPARWPRIVDIARALHFALPAQPDSRALQHFLDNRRDADPLRFPDLSLTIIKLLGSGEYVADFPGDTAPGHFGLASRDYTHSTAPNRRYPDLITQRLVKAALDGVPAPYTTVDLVQLAAHCTAQEDEVARVERQVAKSAAAMLFGDRVGGRYDALVTGVTDTAVWVRVIEPPAEGRLVAGEGGLDVGDAVCVTLAEVDVALGHIDFERC